MSASEKAIALAAAESAAASAVTAAEAAEEAVAIVGVDTADDLITILDADAGSTFRAQQDAPLSATYAPLAEVWADPPTGVAATDTAAIIAAVTTLGSSAGVVRLHSGAYAVNAPIWDDMQSGQYLIGQSKFATILQQSANLATPLISAAGVGFSLGPDHHQHLGLVGLTIWNPSRTYSGDFIHLEAVDRVTIRDVNLLACQGTALRMREVWDSVFWNLQVENSGDSAALKPAIDMDELDSGVADGDSGCNNLTFAGNIQVEASQYVGVYFGPHTRGCRWGGKIHGDLPTPTPYAGVILDGAYGNFLTDFRFTGLGAEGLWLQNGSDSNVIANGSIDTCPTYGLRVSDSDNNVIDGLAFATRGGSSANATDILVEGTSFGNRMGDSNSMSQQPSDTTAGATGLFSRSFGQAQVFSAPTGTVLPLSKLSLRRTTPAAFEAIAQEFEGFNSSSVATRMGLLSVVPQSVTASSESADFQVQLRSGGAIGEKFRVRNNGEAQIFGPLNHDGSTVGFYGAAPVAKAANPGVASGTDAAVINAIVTALRNLGLVT